MQTSPRGLGALHTSAMGLAGSLLAEQDFVSTVQPTSDDELQDADRIVSCKYRPTEMCLAGDLKMGHPAGPRAVSKFDETVTRTVEDLQMALLEYFKSTSKRPGE